MFPSSNNFYVSEGIQKKGVEQMLTESYGGCCPNCGYDRMLVRYGSAGYFVYDACPNCAFVFGTNEAAQEDEELIDDFEFWEGEYQHLKSSMDDIKEDGLLGVLLYIESLSDIKEIESVFDYTNFDWEKMEWKE